MQEDSELNNMTSNAPSNSNPEKLAGEAPNNQLQEVGSPENTENITGKQKDGGSKPDDESNQN